MPGALGASPARTIRAAVVVAQVRLVLLRLARLLVLVALAETPGSLGPRPSARHLALPALAAAAPAALLGAQPVLLAAVASSSLTNLRYYRYRHPAHRSGVYGG